MNEDVLVPNALLRIAELRGLFATSVAYIASLKPEPTKRRSGRRLEIHQGDRDFCHR